MTGMDAIRVEPLTVETDAPETPPDEQGDAPVPRRGPEDPASSPAQVIDDRWVAAHLPERPDRAHKNTFGRVLVVAGSLEYPGAALLVALGAARAGAGVVCLAVPESLQAWLAGRIPELTWLPLLEEARGVTGPGGWRMVSSGIVEYDAVVIGPGLGRHPATLRRVRRLVAEVRRPVVIDADGLNALAEEHEWWRTLAAPAVLTPHPGEFARLRRDEAVLPDDDAARVAVATEAATLWGHVVVLKGANTVVAAPDGRALRSSVATPALASAGSGDVLAGVVATMLAGGLEPFTAATCAVAVHARAGLMCEERIGRAGVLASDVAAALPEALRRFSASGGA